MASTIATSNSNQIQFNRPPPEIRIEVADNLASSPFIDRFFNSAVIILSLLLLSGGIWVLSKVVPETQFLFLEEIALAVFTVTLIAFAVLGLTAMCVVCGSSEDFDSSSSIRRRKDNEMMVRSVSQEAERSVDTVCENSSVV
jgi:hypothetical protein